jgi:hypothetical protein
MPKLEPKVKYKTQPSTAEFIRSAQLPLIYIARQVFADEKFVLVGAPSIADLTNARILAGGNAITVTDSGALDDVTVDATLVVFSAFEPTTTFAGMLWLRPPGPAASETVTLSDSPTVSIV